MSAIVIGAGVAGLTAAKALRMAGRDVVVLEARSRLGGRIHTVHDPALAVAVELGAEFVQGRYPEFRSALRKEKHFELAGDWRAIRKGEVVDSGADWQPMKRVLATRPKHDLTFSEVARQAIATGQWNEEQQTTAKAYIEGYHAAAPDQISAQSIAAQESGGDDALIRLQDGYEAVPNELARGLREHIRFNWVVNTIRWRRGKVRIEASTRTGVSLPPLDGSQVLITVPIGVLHAKPDERGAIRFVPDPPTLRKAIERMAMGPVAKLGLRFRSRFWELGGAFSKVDLRKVSFLQGPGLDFPTFWTTNPVKSPFLTAWAGGPKAAMFRQKTEAFFAHQAAASLGEMLGVPARGIEQELDGWYYHDWQSDPYSRGAYPWILVGGIAAQKDLAEPIQNTLFFAGDALDTEHVGTVHGAIRSARRSAGSMNLGHSFE